MSFLRLSLSNHTRTAKSITHEMQEIITTITTLQPYIWPLTAKSLKQWMAVLVVVFTIWAKDFICASRQPRSIKQDDDKKRSDTDRLMAALLAYSQSERKKLSSDQKLPEAERVYSLLWDDTHECRTTRYGTLHNNGAVEDLFKAIHQQELQTIMDRTRKARDNRSNRMDETADVLADLAAHESGEKLLNAINFAKKARKDLGADFVNDRLLSQAQEQYQVVFKDQSAKREALMVLIRPVIPTIMYCCVATIANSGLRGVFHQIGPWTEAVETAANGDITAAYTLLFNLWLGHLVIEFVQRIDSCYAERAESLFGQRVRNGVLAAMVRQDYEYFDKNSPGVLQERLNRDASELGQNLIRFPARMFNRVTWIIVNVVTCYCNTPFQLFATAMAPLVVMIPLQYVVFRWNERSHSRQRKVQEQASAATSEVLREFKTVRQFAMEPEETTSYARGELGRHCMGESMHTQRECMRWGFWSAFVSSLCLTVYLGIPYVTSGRMRVHELVGTVFQINCNLSFPMREICEEIPKIGKLLQPLGRICDLLQANPKIEPDREGSQVELSTAGELGKLLARCDTIADKSTPTENEKSITSCHTVLRRQEKQKEQPRPQEESKGVVAAPSTTPRVGSQLVSLQTADHAFIKVHDKATIDLQELTYPVRALFSSGRRPVRFRGKIEFRDVHFSYPIDLRKPVLQGLSFVVEPGQKVALVGSTGCGKSSCMVLLQRLYEPQSGEILIDDVPIQEYDVHYLRSRVVIVDQNTTLFQASIRDNIAYGVDVSDEEIVQACKDAKAWDFISEKPDQLETMLLDGGKNLSGGQRQRLAIARAMVRNPDVILLDEATSALDNENEKLVQGALDKLARHGSALVIAHRLSTIMDSDKIVVVDHGQKVEEGTHHELLADTSARYPSHSDTAKLSSASSIASTQSFCSNDGRISDDGFALLPMEQGQASQSGEEPGAGADLFGEPLGPPPDAPPSFTSHNSCDSTCSGPLPPKLVRQPSAPPIMFASVEHTASYKRLWDAAAGTNEEKNGLSMCAMQKKVNEMESNLLALKSKLGCMKTTKCLLLSRKPIPPTSPSRHHQRAV